MSASKNDTSDHTQLRYRNLLELDHDVIVFRELNIDLYNNILLKNHHSNHFRILLVQYTVMVAYIIVTDNTPA